MSKVEDASLAVKKGGRTIDALANPRKYQSPLSSLSKQDFEQAWQKQPAWILANFAHIAYYDSEHIEASLQDFGFDVTCYDDGHGRQGFLAADAEKAIVCFRGTEPSDIHDLFDDIRIYPIAYQGATVHRGFLDATLSLMEKGIEADLKQLSQHKLYVTGHSLGGAMAVIAGMFYPFEKVVTFGEPRVGKDIRLFGGNDDSNHIRVVNGKDIVTTIIPEMPAYKHHGMEIKLPLIDSHEFFVGNLLDHSIIHYVNRVTTLSPNLELHFFTL